MHDFVVGTVEVTGSSPVPPIFLWSCRNGFATTDGALDLAGSDRVLARFH